MKRKFKSVVLPADLPVFETGETVSILRPNLWSGCSGVVVSQNEGLHRIKIDAKPDGSTFSCFHADVRGDQLESKRK